MPGQRVLAIGLDGLAVTYAEQLMAAGEMPALAELRKRGARVLLDHGAAQRTGLGWEHFASGLSPDAARRWAAVEFDPATYEVWQLGARFVPWWANVERRVVVFDTPYVDLRRAPKTRGIVAWGAHDAGTFAASRPSDLLGDMVRRFGDYPSDWMYGTPWPSAALSQAMGEALTRALDTRTRAARWLASERLADWDFFFAVSGEVHSSIEGLWHGVDPAHPLHGHASSTAAARGLLEVHRALDRMVGELMRAAGDAAVCAFTMGGMGPNHSDVPSMVLLPELLYRHAFGRHLLTVPRAWAESPRNVPLLAEGDDWVAQGRTWVPMAERPRRLADLRAFLSGFPILKAGVRGVRAAVTSWRAGGAAGPRLDLDWQPAQRYRPHWPRMRAFALPSYYDGQIRLNLRGRERDGLVEPSRYEDTCREIEALLRECRNPRTGEPVVELIDRAATRDPLALDASESDLRVVWRGLVTALEHPRLGLVGPVPLRRTGGHTGSHGVAYIAAPGIAAGDRGVRSSFDVAPTIVELLGCPRIPGMTGTSLLGR